VGHQRTLESGRSLCPRKQTFASVNSMYAMCQKRTLGVSNLEANFDKTGGLDAGATLALGIRMGRQDGPGAPELGNDGVEHDQIIFCSLSGCSSHHWLSDSMESRGSTLRRSGKLTGCYQELFGY
jgi:hypothetical protein